MPQALLAVVAIAALTAAAQLAWIRTAHHVDVHLVPPHARRRVAWLTAHSTRVLGTATAVVVAGCAVLVAAATRH